MELKKMAVMLDTNNRAFTESWLQEFRHYYEPAGGEVVAVKEFASGSADLSFLNMVKDVVADEPEAVLVLASALDTALIAQQFVKKGYHLPIFTSEWSFTSDLLNFGGRAVEGLISYHSFNSESRRPQYLAFRENFVKRFGYETSFASVLAYDATRLLLKAIGQNADPGRLKRTLLGTGTFSGLQSDFKLDENGDVYRTLFQTVVVNGQFKVVN